MKRAQRIKAVSHRAPPFRPFKVPVAWVALALLFGAPLAAAQALSAPLKALVAPTRTSAAGAGASAPNYVVIKPEAGRPWSPSGWGLFATIHGRSMDLADARDWSIDPNARSGEVDAGLAWRGEGLAATLGYVTPTIGEAKWPYPREVRSEGLVGVNISVRSR